MRAVLSKTRCKVMGFFVFPPNFFIFFKLIFLGCVVFLTSKEEGRDVFCKFSSFSHSFTENLHSFTFCREGRIWAESEGPGGQNQGAESERRRRRQGQGARHKCKESTPTANSPSRPARRRQFLKRKIEIDEKKRSLLWYYGNQQTKATFTK